MRPTLAGKILGILLVLAILGVGFYVIRAKQQAPSGGITSTPGQTVAPTSTDANATPAPVVPAPNGKQGLTLSAAAPATDELMAETKESPNSLGVPQTYIPKNNVLDIEISEYPGYAGLIAANNGLEPTEDSLFYKKYGFKVHMNISEEESWPALNAGKMAAAPTTVDVLAVYGKQFNVVVPIQIGYSRGADGLVVRQNINRVNDLRGKVVATAQFTEVDFLVRYLAQEAGIPINMLPNLRTAPDPDAINLVFTKEGFGAGDLLAKDLKNNWGALSACTTWSPKLEDVVQSSEGKLKTLVTNRNLLIVADILVVNKGFAQQNPDMLQGLVGGILEGNKMVRENPAKWQPVIEKAFKWEAGKAANELVKVHLSNLAENLAFFSGEIDSAGSFAGIYASATLGYGTKAIRDPVSAEKFMNTQWLKKLNASGIYDGEKIEIAPVRSSGGASVERNPLLSKNIRFLFEPNIAKLEIKDPANLKNLDSIKELLRVSPGSSVFLRGHVDDGQKPEFAKGGEQMLRQGALRAMKLSKERADEIKRLLLDRGVPDDRLDTIGVGWEEPLGTNGDENRRVEVQWFTLE